MTLNNFSWVLPDLLAGCAMPGGRSIDPYLELASQGIRLLVSLEQPGGDPARHCTEAGIEWLRFPVKDFGIPDDKVRFGQCVTQAVESLNSRAAVCVHCRAGVGRTGMVLSCILGKYLLLSPEASVAAVRKSRAAVETPGQYTFIKEFLSE